MTNLLLVNATARCGLFTTALLVVFTLLRSWRQIVFKIWYKQVYENSQLVISFILIQSLLLSFITSEFHP